jgi:alcohol dehydrogenase
MGSAAPQRDVPLLLSLWKAGRLPVERLHSETRALPEINTAMDALDEGRVVRQIVVPNGR